MIILRLAVVIAGIFTLVLVGLMAGLVVEPLVDVASESQAVTDTGFDDGIKMAMTIGLAMVLPLLGVAALVWLNTAGLQDDIGPRRRY